MKKILIKLLLQVVKFVLDKLSDYVGTLPAIAVNNGIISLNNEKENYKKV